MRVQLSPGAYATTWGTKKTSQSVQKTERSPWMWLEKKSGHFRWSVRSNSHGTNIGPPLTGYARKYFSHYFTLIN